MFLFNPHWKEKRKKKKDYFWGNNWQKNSTSNIKATPTMDYNNLQDIEYFCPQIKEVYNYKHPGS